MSKRGHGEGSIASRGENSWRLRYRIGGKRYSKTFHGTAGEARKELRALLKAGDDNTHVPPAKITLAAWVEEWSALRARKITTGSIEHYNQLLRVHVLPVLGSRPLQEIDVRDIDRLYRDLLDKDLNPRTVAHIGVILGNVFAVAVKKRLLNDNPVSRADAPKVKPSEAWTVLDKDQLIKLVRGFRGHHLHTIVATAAFTGMRRGEILALQWGDINFTASTITVTRALEETEQHGRRLKSPKAERSRRVITIDAGLLALLGAERETHLAIAAGVPAGAEADLSLIRLPPDALCFPSPTAPFDFTRLRKADVISKRFADTPSRSVSTSGFTTCGIATARNYSRKECRFTRSPSDSAIAPRCCYQPMHTPCRPQAPARWRSSKGTAKAALE